MTLNVTNLFSLQQIRVFVVLNRMQWLYTGLFSSGIILHFIDRYIVKDGSKISKPYNLKCYSRDSIQLLNGNICRIKNKERDHFLTW